MECLLLHRIVEKLVTIGGLSSRTNWNLIVVQRKKERSFRSFRKLESLACVTSKPLIVEEAK